MADSPGYSISEKHWCTNEIAAITVCSVCTAICSNLLISLIRRFFFHLPNVTFHLTCLSSCTLARSLFEHNDELQRLLKIRIFHHTLCSVFSHNLFRCGWFFLVFDRLLCAPWVEVKQCAINKKRCITFVALLSHPWKIGLQNLALLIPQTVNLIGLNAVWDYHHLYQFVSWTAANYPRTSSHHPGACARHLPTW